MRSLFVAVLEKIAGFLSAVNNFNVYTGLFPDSSAYLAAVLGSPHGRSGTGLERHRLVRMNKLCKTVHGFCQFAGPFIRDRAL